MYLLIIHHINNEDMRDVSKYRNYRGADNMIKTGAYNMEINLINW